MRLVLSILLVAACATAGVDPTVTDGDAETAPDQPIGKDDAASFAGLYASHATTFRAGDVPSLELRVTANPGIPSHYDYIRARCYHAGCAERLPETDRYDVYTSTAGKTYVRFWSFTVARDGSSRGARNGRSLSTT